MESSNLQESKPKCDVHGDLLFVGQWKAVDKPNGEEVRDKVSGDVECGICQIEVVYVDAFLVLNAQIPCPRYRTALEGTSKDIGQALTGHNGNHDQRSSS